MSNKCFHCGLDNPIPPTPDLSKNLFGGKKSFCCYGCLSIAETLDENGFSDFYKFRESVGSKPVELVPSELESIDALDTPEILSSISSHNSSNNTQTIILGVDGITCAACGWLIEKTITNLDFVDSVSVNITNQKAEVTWYCEPGNSSSLSNIIKSFSKIGYKAYPFSEDKRIDAFENTNRLYVKRLIVASIGMMQVMSYALGIYIGYEQGMSEEHRYYMHWLSFIVSTPVIFYAAKPFFSSAWVNLKVKRLGMNLPVSLALATAYSASCYSLITNGNVYYFDSVVMFTFFLLIGRFLEHRARFRAVMKQSNFKQLVPLSVRIKDGTKYLDKLVANVVSDDIISIPAGGIIPVDGVLLNLSAEVNEAIVTGEYLPVVKSSNDPLISGSVNNATSILMRASKDFASSRIFELIQLQQEAETIKPQATAVADKISHWYVSILFITILFSASIWWSIDASRIFEISLSILVVSCPCALSLATPAAFAAATSQLSDLGILIRNSSALTNLSQINHVFFDKTGTLTAGKISLSKIENHSNYTITELKNIAYLLEGISSHPIAQAFNSFEIEHRSRFHSAAISDHMEHIGQGISAKINKKLFGIGSTQFFLNNYDKDLNLPTNKKSLITQSLELAASEHPGMVIHLVEEEKLIATFYLDDKIKESASTSVKNLRAISPHTALGFKVSMLTGDSVRSAKQIADKLAINAIIAEATPEKKLSTITEAQAQGDHVLMAGDGFNDLGALGSADFSLSLASSPHLSKSKSDAVLVSENLDNIPTAISLAMKAQRIIKQNLAWAIGYNLIAVPFAAFGFIPAWLAAIGMSTSSLIVVLNALRLRH